MFCKKPNAAKQRGFTLIELLVVVAVLGILATFAVRKSNDNAKAGVKAMALYDTAESLTQQWSSINSQCGTPTAITGSAIPAAGKTVLDVLLKGRSYVAAAYQPCYDSSGVMALSGVGQGADGAETIQGYAATLSGGGTSPISVAYATVGDTVTLPLVTKYGSGVTTLAASDAANAVVQYSTAAGDGTRTVTVFRPL